MRQGKLTSHTATSSCEPDGETDLRAEIGGQDSDRRDEKHPAAESDAEALSEHRLPELLAKTQHHEAEDHTEATDQQEQSQVAAIKDRSSAGADQEHAY